MPIKLKVFVSGLAYDKGKSGIADYTNNVIRELSKENQLTILMPEDEIENFPIKNENITFLPAPKFTKKAILSMIWHLFILPFKIKKSDYDLIFLPAGNRRLLSFYPLPTVVTFHDLSQFHIENKYDKFRMFYIKKIVPYYLKKAPAVMAISKSTADDMMQFYGMSRDKIVINYNGYNSDRFSADLDASDVRMKYHLTKDYLLYIARIEHPGKNHLNLVKAYEKLPQELRDKYDLVLPGSDWNGAEEVHSYVSTSSVNPNIKFLGFVPDEDLPPLYCGAKLYVFPSLYEGFGIPLVEAMASGIPVICSDCSSLPEVGGEAVKLFNPKSVESIASTIAEVLSDNACLTDMREKGFKEIKRFSWKQHASKIIEIYNEIK
ncbi:MAG: glycosyltransferase family 1 protein [Candidatus Zophobacter franzmannii]|nr:glycosyltransferase family 1 protein [Candidatus Zophobacter franzmannii]